MDPWDRLNEKINNAKKKALNTDSALESELLTRCPVCGGRMTNSTVNSLKCTDCGHEKPTNKSIIRQALEENPGITAFELSKITGISRAEISAYLDDGFLELSKSSIGSLKCEICGISIFNGTVCGKCKKAYSQDFGKVNVREGNAIGVAPIIESNKTVSKMRFGTGGDDRTGHYKR